MEDGAWRNSSTLEMGFKKNPKTSYTACSYCKTIHIVNENTAGVICSECGRYFSVDFTYFDINDLCEYERIDIDSVVFKNHAPHIVGEGQQRMLEFRSGMENKAEEFRLKQVAKKKAGLSPIYHGPIDTKTKLRTK